VADTTKRPRDHRHHPGQKRLIWWPRRAIFRSDGRPLGEYQPKKVLRRAPERIPIAKIGSKYGPLPDSLLPVRSARSDFASRNRLGSCNRRRQSFFVPRRIGEYQMEVVLHIGIEKTGTTAIQQFLYSNVEALSGQALALLDCAGKPNNRLLPAWFRDDEKSDDMLRSKGIFDAEGKRRFFEGWPESLSAEIAALSRNHKRLIITSEHFHSRLPTERETQRVAAFCSAHFEKARVVVYLRRQDELMESLYSTALRVGHDIGKRRFARAAIEKSDYFDFHALLKRWEAAFGRESLEIGVYDPKCLHNGNVVSDFARRTGIDFATTNQTTVRANKAVGRGGEAIYRFISALTLQDYPSGAESQHAARRRLGVALRRRAHSRLSKVLHAGPPLRFAPGLKDEVLAAYEDSNRRLSEEYLEGRRVC